MADVEKAKAVLEAERNAVLGDLGKWKARERKARSREAKRREMALEEMHGLLMRGKAARVPVVDLADAVGISRQMAHRLIREAQGDPGTERPGQEERSAIKSFFEEQPGAAAFQEFLQAKGGESAAERASRLGLPLKRGRKRKGGGGEPS